METKKRDRLSKDNDDVEMQFDDDCSDRSTISTTVEASSKATTKQAKVYPTQFSPELLSQYYSRLFPFTLLTQWLSYSTSALQQDPTSNENNNSNNGSKLLSHREFSFTIEPMPGEEIYIRYQSFKSQSELS